MNFFALTIALSLVWVTITGSFSAPNFALGAIIAFGGLWVVRNRMTSPVLVRRLRRGFSLAVLFFYELVLSALRVSALVISPNIKAKLKPGIVAFPLTAKTDVEITLLANLITLTPGTLSVDVSEDRKMIYVHAISIDDRDALIRDIADGFERKIIEVFE